VEHPAFIADEVQLAEAHKKQIIPVRIDSSTALPEGLELPLQNHQYIQLWRNHRGGLEKLLSELQSDERAPDPKVIAVLRARGKRSVRRARIVFRQNEVGKKVVKAGIALGAAAVALGAAAAVGSESGAEAERKKASELEAKATEQYKTRVRSVLSDCENEFNLALEMSPAQYSAVFRPKIQRLLGTLEGMAPPGSLLERHRQLVARLEEAVREYDNTMASLVAEDIEGVALGVRTLRLRWFEAGQAFEQWET
jgi:hypothetical protein